MSSAGEGYFSSRRSLAEALHVGLPQLVVVPLGVRVASAAMGLERQALTAASSFLTV